MTNQCLLRKYLVKSAIFRNNILELNFLRSKTSAPVFKMDKRFMLDAIKASKPKLDNEKHKGQAGRIGIIGGSLEYTGAPYFAGISALKVGADLAHIFCTSSAATVIKSYSPELIVHPLLDNENAVNEIKPWFERLHAIVIGPGLGRDNGTFQVVSKLIEVIRDKKIPLVIDADGLFLVNQHPQVIENFQSPLILTPNSIEFERLSWLTTNPERLSNNGNVVILKKGAFDEVISCYPDVMWMANEGGSGRRCGGQGDLLSGSIAIFLHWILKNQEINMGNKLVTASSLACYAASLLVRRCNERAFKIHGRSMLASDMIDCIHGAFEELYGQ